MKPILGLVVKDCYSGGRFILANLAMATLLIGLGSALGSAAHLPWLVSLASIFGLFSNLFLAGQDEASDFSLMALSWPIRRRDYVAARYLSGLILITGFSLIGGLIATGIRLAGSLATGLIWRGPLLGLAGGLILQAVILPVWFGLSGRRTNLAGLTLMLISLIPTSLAIKAWREQLGRLLRRLMPGAGQMSGVMYWILIAVAVSGLSYWLAVGLFKHKDI